MTIINKIIYYYYYYYYYSTFCQSPALSYTSLTNQILEEYEYGKFRNKGYSDNDPSKRKSSSNEATATAGTKMLFNNYTDLSIPSWHPIM